MCRGRGHSSGVNRWQPYAGLSHSATELMLHPLKWMFGESSGGVGRAGVSSDQLYQQSAGVCSRRAQPSTEVGTVLVAVMEGGEVVEQRWPVEKRWHAEQLEPRW